MNLRFVNLFFFIFYDDREKKRCDLIGKLIGKMIGKRERKRVLCVWFVVWFVVWCEIKRVLGSNISAFPLIFQLLLNLTLVTFFPTFLRKSTFLLNPPLYIYIYTSFQSPPNGRAWLMNIVRLFFYNERRVFKLHFKTYVIIKGTLIWV